jgi:ATP-dependent Clp endopeptidase proteolytic subunit ClpP
MINENIYRMKATKKNWYKLKAFKNQDNENVAHLVIDDVIDSYWGLSASDLNSQIKALDTDIIKVDINSPGGDVFDGFSLYNNLKNHPARVETNVTGLAASIASVIYMAGDVRTMDELSQVMIHRAWALSIGSATEMEKMANTLRKVDGQLISLYSKSTGLDPVKVENMLEEETWMTALEAQEMGFGQVVSAPEAKAKNLYDLSMYKNVPDNLKEITNQKKLEAAKAESEDKRKQDRIREMMKERLAALA